MSQRDRHQPPQPALLPSLSKAVEAGLLQLYNQPTLNVPRTTTMTNSCISSVASSEGSSTTPSSPLTATKKRKWYRPKLKLNLKNADWVWAGFIKAGSIAPIGRGPSGRWGEDEDEEWEQLPAYTPPRQGEVGLSEHAVSVGPVGGQEPNGWIVAPPRLETSLGSRLEGVGEPPEYR